MDSGLTLVIVEKTEGRYCFCLLTVVLWIQFDVGLFQKHCLIEEKIDME